jgi:hypothetical protein
MNSSNRVTFFLSGVMLLAGGGALFASTFLPPLLELRALRLEYQQYRRQVDELEERLIRLTKQKEHIQDDPAYWERLMRKEFGTVTPGVQEMPVNVQPAPVDAAPTDADALQNESDQELEQTIWSRPYLAVFILPQTRTLVMSMAGIIILTSLFLMIRSTAPHPPDSE